MITRISYLMHYICRNAVSFLKFSAAQENEQVNKNHVGDIEFFTSVTVLFAQLDCQTYREQIESSPSKAHFYVAWRLWSRLVVAHLLSAF